ncbi:MAG: hypothetical protein MRERC_1c096 [Mycoplasmataceae bacterium RC_NB112A]|nr:MAG: hypothetical protein MRERC_1c096 [Mycoplasmataceae bacterium RC_NB112A]
MSKHPRIDKSTADGGRKNELYVPASMNPPKPEVKIFGEGGNLVKSYHDLSADLKVNRAIVKLMFDSEVSRYSSDDSTEVVYRVVNPKPSSEEEWKKMKKEVLTDFLINKSSGILLDAPSPYENGLRYILKKEKDKINLIVEETNGKGRKVIESERVELEDEYFWKEVIRVEDNLSFTPPKKTTWLKTTKGKVSLLVGTGSIVILVAIFRKKIWSWVRRSKKKPREEIIL